MVAVIELSLILGAVVLFKKNRRAKRAKRHMELNAPASAVEVEVIPTKESKELRKERERLCKIEEQKCSAQSVIDHYEPLLSRFYSEADAVRREMNEAVPYGKEYRKLSTELYRLEEKIFRIEGKLEAAGFTLDREIA